MRRLLSFLLITGLLLACAPESRAASKPAKSTEPSIGEVAKTITMITGVAISPLLGVGAYGAWTYFDTPSEQKANLSWYAKPMFWIPALLVVALVFIKDIGGTAIPDSLKQPFDVLEAVERQLRQVDRCAAGPIEVGASVAEDEAVTASVESASDNRLGRLGEPDPDEQRVERLRSHCRLPEARDRAEAGAPVRW